MCTFSSNSCLPPKHLLQDLKPGNLSINQDCELRVQWESRILHPPWRLHWPNSWTRHRQSFIAMRLLCKTNRRSREWQRLYPLVCEENRRTVILFILSSTTAYNAYKQPRRITMITPLSGRCSLYRLFTFDLWPFSTIFFRRDQNQSYEDLRTRSQKHESLQEGVTHNSLILSHSGCDYRAAVQQEGALGLGDQQLFDFLLVLYSLRRLA